MPLLLNALEVAQSSPRVEELLEQLFPHVVVCAQCRSRLETHAASRCDKEKAVACLDFAERGYDSQAIFRAIASTRPRPWSRAIRWPEAEALLESSDRSAAIDVPTRLARLLHDVDDIEDDEPVLAEAIRHGLRTVLEESSAPALRALAVVLAKPADARAPEADKGVPMPLERRSAEVSPAFTSGDQEVAAVRNEAATLRSFRMRAHLALEEFLENALTAKIVRPLERIGWEGVAVYLPDARRTHLEIVAATDTSAVYKLRHPLHRHPGVHADIEADVYHLRRAERITGGVRDPRYNRHVFETYHHDRLLERIFIPLVLVRRRGDCSVDQDACTWVQDEHTWIPRVPDGYQLEVIGNVSVSRCAPAPYNLVVETLKFSSAQAAVAAHGTTLSGLCEKLLTLLMTSSGARHGALHVGANLDAIYAGDEQALVSRHGEGVSLGGVADRPRRTGIGADAVEKGGPLLFLEDILRDRNPKLVEMGIRACSPSPLISAAAECVGISYLHFDEPPAAAPKEELTETVGYVLGAALRVQQRGVVREHVLSEAKSFTAPPNETLPGRMLRMANFAWNLLGCDHVSIIAGLGANQRTIRHAGRYVTGIEIPEGWAALGTLNGWLRATELGDEFTSVVEAVSQDPKLSRGSFALHQGFEATAVVPMRDATHVVGHLIIDYRVKHEFGDLERRLLMALANVFATGLALFQIADDERSPAGTLAPVPTMHAAVPVTAALEPELESRRAPLPASDVLHVGFTPSDGWLVHIRGSAT